MSIENQTENKTFAKKWARRAAVGAAGVTATVALVPGLQDGYEAVKDRLNGPEMNGSQTVRIEPDDNVNNIVKQEVENGRSHTGAVVDAIVNNPKNAHIFENGTELGTEDLGRDLDIPKSVED